MTWLKAWKRKASRSSSSEDTTQATMLQKLAQHSDSGAEKLVTKTIVQTLEAMKTGYVKKSSEHCSILSIHLATVCRNDESHSALPPLLAAASTART